MKKLGTCAPEIGTGEFFKESDFVGHNGMTCVDLADKFNRLLQERGAVVYGGQFVLDNEAENRFCWTHRKTSVDTHTALLINIQPIVKPDTAESLLREILACYDSVAKDPHAYMERARKLLEGK